MTSNKNIEFIDMMIDHHKEAIKMVNEYDGEVTVPELVDLMNSIKKNQSNEIDTMKKIKKNINTQAEKSLEETKEEPTYVTQTIKRKLSVI